MDQYYGDYHVLSKIKIKCLPIIVPNIGAKELNYLLKESGCCTPGRKWARRYDLKAYLKHMPPKWQRMTSHYFCRVAQAIHYKWPNIDVEQHCKLSHQIEDAYDYILYELLDLRREIGKKSALEEMSSDIFMDNIRSTIQEQKRRLMATLIKIEEGPMEEYPTK